MGGGISMISPYSKDIADVTYWCQTNWQRSIGCSNKALFCSCGWHTRRTQWVFVCNYLDIINIQEPGTTLFGNRQVSNMNSSITGFGSVLLLEYRVKTNIESAVTGWIKHSTVHINISLKCRYEMIVQRPKIIWSTLLFCLFHPSGENETTEHKSFPWGRWGIAGFLELDWRKCKLNEGKRY